MHAVKSDEQGYYVTTKAGVPQFVRARSSAKWTSKTAARRIRTILSDMGFVVRVVSIND